MVALNLALLLFSALGTAADKRWSLGSEDQFKEHIMTLLADFKPCHAGETTPAGVTVSGRTTESPGQGGNGTTAGNGGGSPGPTTAGPGETTPGNPGGNGGSTTGNPGGNPGSSPNPDGGNTGTTPGNGGGSSTGNPGGNPTTPNPGQGGNGSTPNPGDGGSTPQPTTVPPPTCPACPIPTEKPCPAAPQCAACPAPATETCPLAPSCNPPRCSLQPVSVPWAANHPAQGIESCFNDGALKTGDQLVIEGTAPPCCPEKLASDKLVWTIDLLSKDKKPWLHIAVVSGWKTLQITAGVGGWYKNVTRIAEVPCPFKPDTDFTVTITNSPDKFDIVLNGQSYTYGHQVAGDHGDQYYNLLMVSYSPLKLKKVGVVRSGDSSAIGLSAPDASCPACPTAAACPAAPTCAPHPECPTCPKSTEKVCPTIAPCPTTAPTTPTPPKPICPADWKYNADTKSCYFLGIKKLTNMDAKNECRKQEATLASIHSEGENMFIYNWLNSSTTNETNFNAWIGAYRTGLGAADFANFDGTPLDYVKWDTGDPNNWGGSEYCVELFSHAPLQRDTKWNDRDCHNPPPAYVCKKPANL